MEIQNKDFDESNLMKPKQKSKVYQDPTTSEKETRCGFAGFHPPWLQILASKKTFVVVYALAGMQQFIVSSYTIGTMSTIEKHFRMSSRDSASIMGLNSLTTVSTLADKSSLCYCPFLNEPLPLTAEIPTLTVIQWFYNYNKFAHGAALIIGAWDVGSLFANIAITYVAAKGHRTRWVAAGMFFMGIAAFLRALPYLLFGHGKNIEMYTKEYYSLMNVRETSLTNGNYTGLKKLGTNVNCGMDNENADAIAFYFMIISQIILGIGTAVYWTIGATYLDDNARKNEVPALLAIVQIIRLFGPTVGFLLSSYTLEFYIDPNLTPLITAEDPRWIGAWWFGWYPIGIACMILTTLLLFFPRSLPRAAAPRNITNTPSTKTKSLSFSDFKSSMRRILSNKIVLFNSFSSVFVSLGVLAQWTFLPKYMELQFRLSASKSNFLTGTIGILCNALGFLAAGVWMSKFKPAPTFLAGWNVLAEFLQVIGYASYTFMSCAEQQYHGHWDSERNLNLTEVCNVKFECGNDIQFAPVCDPSTGMAFYSACHAGCNSSILVNGTLEFNGCACVTGLGNVIEGLCPTDCSINILLFVTVMGLSNFTLALGRSANTLLQFRCVDGEDKSLSIGITETLLSLLAFMPAPILYGVIIDWTCIVWGDNCGKRGNCWIYDGFRLRSAFNITAAGFLLAGTLLDCFVWYYSKDLKIYDEDINIRTEKGKNDAKTPIVKNDNDQNKEVIALPRIETLDK